ncbi:MAG: hypothetical protein ACRD00_06380 [Thermoanaerobaculia bacterium]
MKKSWKGGGRLCLLLMLSGTLSSASFGHEAGSQKINERGHGPYCDFGAGTLDPGRQVDWQREAVIVLAKDSPVRVDSCEKEAVACVLRRGTLVAVGREDGVARWVVYYGNNVAAAGWKPEGRTLEGPEELAEVRVPGPPADISDEDIRRIARAMAEKPRSSERETQCGVPPSCADIGTIYDDPLLRQRPAWARGCGPDNAISAAIAVLMSLGRR